jgi:dihydrodipicolinate synthase/N-acetylneuraminate lyase
MKNKILDIFNFNTIVPIPTQFNKDLTINFNAIKKHIYLLKKKNVNLFYLGQSASELERLSLSERIKLANYVTKIIRPKAKLILQPLGFTSIEDQIFEAKKLEKIGCDFMVVEPIHIKGKQYFYSNRFKNSEYSPNRHDDYYVKYMKTFSKKIKVPILFHLKEFSFGKTLSIKALDKILKIKNIVGLKEHNNSINIRKKHFVRYGLKKKKICFDGFSKEDFITTSKYGVKSRHSNFSWFDPVWDQIFIKLIKNKKDKLLKEMVKIESSIKNAIILTGYAGYKYLMKIVNFTSLQGHVKMPGCNLNISQKKILSKAFKRFNKKKLNFMKNNNF